MEVRLLGPVEIASPEGSVALGGPKERAVLAVLALAAPSAVTDERLLESIWGDDPPRTATKTLHSYVSRLRRAIAGTGITIETRGNGYALEGAVDVRRAEAAVATARRELQARAPEAAAQLLRGALAMWRGAPLAGLGDLPFTAPAVARLDALQLDAIELALECDLACGRHEEVAIEAADLVTRWPLREQLWVSFIVALYRSGRQSDALRAYQDLRSHLLDELGIDPSPEVRELERKILRQDPSLEFHPVTLPSGDVTFVFTDIEGSTALFERLGDGYAPVLETHRRLVRGAMARGGVEVRADGDGFFFAFGDAAAAVDACVNAQRALNEEAWPAGTDVRVRMGVHQGRAEPVAGDYIAIAVHQAARVMAAAHGGQILLSERTAHAVRGGLVHGASLMDLGAHHLRDFAEPEHIFQVAHPELQASFPPLRTLSIMAHNLPVLRTSFVGRSEDVAEVARQVLDTGVVTVAGPGGVGKTRLAIEVASTVLDQFPDGAWLVELAPLHDASQVAAAVASALQIPGQQGRPLEESIVDALKPKRTLLVLDNCEHLVDAVAAFTELVVHAAPNVAVLATSREALRVDGEAIWRLGGLAVPDAADPPDVVTAADSTRLFIERAMLADPRFRVDDVTAPIAGHICRRLDGMPLAIELAAARLGDVSVDEIAAGLDDRFATLTSGRRTALPRQQTLRATIAWSYDLLDERERSLWRRLSVFAGRASVDAAAEVCGFGAIAPSEVRELVGALARRSIVTATDDRVLLLESVMEFGRERLAESGEADVVEDRFVAWAGAFSKRARESLGTDEHAWQTMLASDHDNASRALSLALGRDPAAALTIATDLMPWWDRTGRYREGRQWLEASLARAEPRDDVTPAMLGEGYHGLAILSHRQADFARTVEVGERAVEIFRAIDHPLLISALNTIGGATFHTRNLTTARQVYEEIYELTRGRSDQEIALVAANLGMLRVMTGDVDAGEELLTDALAKWRVIGNRASTAMVLTNLAQVAFVRSDLATARGYLDEALAIQRDGTDAQALIQALTNAGIYAMAQGDLDDSRRYLEEAIERARTTANLMLLPGSLRVLGDLEIIAGRAKAARAAFEEARDVADRGGQTLHREAILYGLANLAFREGDHEDARRLFAEAAETRRTQGNLTAAASALAERAWAEVALGDVEAAAATVAEGFGLAGDTADQRLLASLHDAQAEVARARGDLAGAVASFQVSVRLRHDLHDLANLHESLLEAGYVCTSLGAASMGAALVGAAEAIRDHLGAQLLPFPAQRHSAAITELRTLLGDGFDEAWIEAKTAELDATVAAFLAWSPPN